MLYAKKEIDSGDMKEVMLYPVQPGGRLLPGTFPKTSGTSEAQKKYNRKKAEYALVRGVNANFGERDLFVAVTFRDDYPGMPATKDEARKIVKKYFAAVRAWRRDRGLPELRYAYVIHEEERKSGRFKGRTLYHFHIFMSGMNRDAAEALWPGGEAVRADRFKPWQFGQEAAAKYMGRGAKGARKFVFSKNCKKPVEHEPEIVRRSQQEIREIAEERIDDAAWWQARVPEGYIFCGASAIWNERNSRYYIRATFRLLRGGGNSARFL